MKLIITLLCLFIRMTGIAQQKHSFSLGVDYVKHAYPSEWRSHVIDKRDYMLNERKVATNSGYWLAYYYKRRLSLRVYMTDLYQKAQYKTVEETPRVFLSSRVSRFYDFVLGYNFSPLLNKIITAPVLDKIEIWTYIGATYLNDGTEAMYKFYNPVASNWETGGYGDLDIERTDRYYNKVRPAAHFQVKYNPIRYILIGLGGTYHHVGKDFKPVSGNISIGLQI